MSNIKSEKLSFELRQRMAHIGSYNVKLTEIEGRWRKVMHGEESRLEDFIAYCKRAHWRTTIKDGMVEVRR